MTRFQFVPTTIHLAISLAMLGCGNEQGFFQELPEQGLSNVPPVRETTYRDEIVQVLTPRVDILWTIDNSCSMQDEQDKLAKNFPIFMDYFLGSGLDYHVGVTSTDLDNADNGTKGKLRSIDGINYIEEDTPSPIDLFVQMASMGISGSPSEKGLGGTYMALETNRDTYNAGFYRDEASVHTIVITDEPDYTPANVVSLPEFVDWYDGLKDDFDNRTFSAIILPQTGGTYASAVAQIGNGLLFDENQDWPPLLDQLGVQAAGFKREYFLSHLPVVGTITVAVENTNGVLREDFKEAVPDKVTGELVGDWSYDQDRNSITFLSYIPEELATVIIEYTLAAAALEEPEEVTETTVL